MLEKRLTAASVNPTSIFEPIFKIGDFAENLTIEGIDLVSLPVGKRILIGKEVTLEVTQIGKECHAGCAIYRQIGKCIMPKEGVFAKVIHGGFVRAGDRVRIGKDGK